MKKIITFFKKCKKAFTLMECVCAIAVVGLLSAIILPLTFSAVNSMNASNALRTTAAKASAQNATQKTDISKTAVPEADKTNNNKTPGGYNTYTTLYVTIDYNKSLSGMRAESAFIFTENCSKDQDNKVSVVYYDLKNGMEEKDVK